MDEDRTYPADAALDLLFVLIAELHRDDVLDNGNLASMRRRLELSGHGDLADRLATIPLANAIDTPENNREGLRLVDE